MSTAEDAQSRIDLPPAPPAQQRILDAGGVACWSEPVAIDTYEPAEPDRYPLFLDRRVYQGSSGKVYPIPFTDRIAAQKTPRLWQAVHLENAFVRLMLLPEIGGRIHIGFDKVRGYDFFYRNNVIKPALVGLAGPWISGGVEFNWPQHHRPATFLPVETVIERAADDDVTVWHSDLDPLQRMRGTHGIRMRGDSALVEVTARLHNRTDEPQTFLWWANVAAASHDEYQSFFPTDVTHVADHARRAVTAFPRADRPYYGVDYPALAASRPGADRLDFAGNIPVPTSYMITDTRDDFFGGYDHRAGAGFVHWAEHTIAPGKKQWTWGDGPIGRAWDAQLTDSDGPYIELMAGVFTDNQPDFSYLAPGETRRFSQYWYPIHEIGPAHQATTEVAVSLSLGPVGGGAAGGSRAGRDALSVRVGVASASVFEWATVALSRGEQLVAEWELALSPGHPFVESVDVTPEAGPDGVAAPRDAASEPGLGAHDFTLRVVADGRELISWTPRRPDAGAEPRVATEPPLPAAIPSSDELYLTGVHLAQYRHPTRSAAPYFEEVLRRDPHDSRAAVALGAERYRHGRYAEARMLFESALERLTRRNLNPASGEASYRLGLVLERLGRFDEAGERFAKAAWDAAWAHPAGLALARLALRAGEARAALEHAEAALRTDASSTEARALRVLALRRLAAAERAADIARATAAAPRGVPSRLDAPGEHAEPAPPTAVERSSTAKPPRASRSAEGGLEAAAASALDDALRHDPLDPIALALAGRLDTADPKTPLVVACWLARAGELAAAIALSDAEAARSLAGAPRTSLPAFGNPDPLRHYLRATWFEALAGAETHAEGGAEVATAAGAAAAAERAAARATDARHAFPAGLDEFDALTAAIAADPADATAPALLGAWLLDAGRPDDARRALETALALGSADPVAWRNAALAIMNSTGDAERADGCFARALELSPHDPRLVFERDVLSAMRGLPAAERLASIESHGDAGWARDDLALHRLDLLLATGRVDEALEVLSTRRFQPFEGGEGQAIALYDRATLAVARRLLETDARAAAELLRSGIAVPETLGEGRHPADSLAERYVLLGDALDAAGDAAALEAWQQARDGAGPLAVAPRPAAAADYWVGIAHLRLGEPAGAEAVWAALDERADELERQKPAVDYFATSLPELLLFDIDTADARTAAARELRSLAREGRAHGGSGISVARSVAASAATTTTAGGAAGTGGEGPA
ncbi:DUF5107 domain-containing protein [Herbiconiux sp. 11R-BC]|uniref:DUF5107 domain-containing protein n=1 Tax=Herbiconiux sp. 11R-BC TaxID=3111637 RepID=UPI003C0AD72B